MPTPAIYHDAYSFAVREWRALSLPDRPSDAQLAQLQQLVTRYIDHRYPGVFVADRRSAISYGVAQAERDLTAAGPGGALGTVAGVVHDVEGAVTGIPRTVEHAAEAAVSAAGRAATGTLQAILRAVELPRAALPTRVPTSSSHAFTTLSRQLGMTLPTRLRTANRARIGIRRIGR